MADTSTKEMRRRGLLHEVTLNIVDGRQDHLVLVAADSRVAAILADWQGARRVELMVEGRPLALEADLDHRGIRVLDPVMRIPLAAFRPARRRGGGTVELPGGHTARWVVPGRSVFECGFFDGCGRSLLRFAHDGTSLVFVDDDHRRCGGAHDPLVLLTLGWFLRLLSGLPPVAGRRGRDGGIRWDGGASRDPVTVGWSRSADNGQPVARPAAQPAARPHGRPEELQPDMYS
ncbi:hypothetical protein [Frankia sp. Cppng1_Ct_nod]|uniref:hypothetical protein n=1 Tax=Frankia sp. Cppng1_Ct_nod TaxID=2897162 RepID=UPI001040E5EC|nr:hypothetical protein [Frankia sp. Cppng1_Ct_nod]